MRPVRRATALAAALLFLACHAGTGTVHYPVSGLDAYEIGAGRQPLVLLHGYGGTPEEWLPFAQTMAVGPDRRFLFPRGPETTEAADGPAGGRAWWRLELDSYRRSSGAEPEMSAADPPGLRRASEQVRTMLGELSERSDTARRVVLGGFSQGAMVAAALAFRSDEPLAALVLLSGTPVSLGAWERGMPARKDLPVFVSHGRQDPVLPFEGSDRLVAAMRRRGLTVTWVPFDGAHDVPASVVAELSAFLEAVDRRAGDRRERTVHRDEANRGAPAPSRQR